MQKSSSSHELKQGVVSIGAGTAHLSKYSGVIMA